MKGKLGKENKTDRGFPWIGFRDVYSNKCSLQCSSGIGHCNRAFDYPGTSFVWLGLDEVKPVVPAKKAAALGIKTAETTGWVDYPLPEAVLIPTRMHLSREQVRGLISRLQEWLDHGKWETRGREGGAVDDDLE